MNNIMSAVFEQPSYTQFRKAFAEEKAPLVVVCGSGLSAPAGLPNWKELRARVEREADAKDRLINQFGQYLLSPKLHAAKSQSDPWVAFKLLREYLSKPVFDNIIERELSPKESEKLPSGYTDLVRLNPRGLVTLNLDKFAGEAIAEAHLGNLITPIYGVDLARRWNELKAARTYLVYLHGVLSDPSTWVMTQTELELMLANAGHAHFLNSVFNDNLVLFAGMSADDIALSKRLLDLANAGFQPRNLYWLTTRLDSDTEAWAAAANVALINYTSTRLMSHGDVIHALVDDCLSFVSRDLPEPPIVGTSLRLNVDSSDVIDDPEILAEQLPERIRNSISVLLDRALRGIGDTNEAFEIYRKFCEKYDYAVDRAFYRGKPDKFSTWFGYKLEGQALGRGNFGEVYSATSPEGNLVAVKIMHKNIFGNDDMLGGFRRGVRSMQIVTENAVPGMVPISASFELPPTIIMPYVGGVSLEDAIRARSDLPWLTKLSISVSIGEIVSGGHALPQTVLHRDLKPSNIMITNMEWTGAFEPEVVVLDFDMSWHKGSKEKDVVFESRDDFGYLAPEQTDVSSRYAARSTRVDSYGFGMTVFFIFGGSAPRPNEALSELWLNRAIKAASHDYDQTWKSAPVRLGRLIQRATQIDQNARIDFASMTHELAFLAQAVKNATELINPEFWAEEVLACAAGEHNYTWDDSIGKGSFALPMGIEVSASANFRIGAVDLTVRYVDRGIKERSSVARYLGSAVTSAAQTLSDSDWDVSDRRHSSSEASLFATISVDALRHGNGLSLTAILKAVQAFQF